MGFPKFHPYNTSENRHPFIRELQHKLLAAFSNAPYETMPTLVGGDRLPRQDGKPRQMRSERRQVVQDLLLWMIAHMDLASMEIGHPRETNDGITIHQVPVADFAEESGYDLQRCYRAYTELAKNGPFLSIARYVTKPTCRARPATKKLLLALFDLLRIDSERVQAVRAWAMDRRAKRTATLRKLASRQREAQAQLQLAAYERKFQKRLKQTAENSDTPLSAADHLARIRHMLNKPDT